MRNRHYKKKFKYTEQDIYIAEKEAYERGHTSGEIDTYLKVTKDLRDIGNIKKENKEIANREDVINRYKKVIKEIENLLKSEVEEWD